MAMQRHLYPDDWNAIAFRIKDSVNWTCEECQRPCRRPDETRMDFVLRLYRDHAETWWPQFSETEKGELKLRFNRFCLTTAHLDHRPENCDRANLRAWCAPCHCRYDLSQMATKKLLKRERGGQRNVFDLLAPIPAGHGKDKTRIQLPIRQEIT